MVVKPTQSAAAAARSAALKRLQGAHAEEWAGLLAEEREARGLDSAPRNRKLEARIERAEAKLAELRAQLEAEAG